MEIGSKQPGQIRIEIRTSFRAGTGPALKAARTNSKVEATNSKVEATNIGSMEMVMTTETIIMPMEMAIVTRT